LPTHKYLLLDTYDVGEIFFILTSSIQCHVALITYPLIRLWGGRLNINGIWDIWECQWKQCWKGHCHKLLEIHYYNWKDIFWNIYKIIYNNKLFGFVHFVMGSWSNIMIWAIKTSPQLLKAILEGYTFEKRLMKAFKILSLTFYSHNQSSIFFIAFYIIVPPKWIIFFSKIPRDRGVCCPWNGHK